MWSTRYSTHFWWEMNILYSVTSFDGNIGKIMQALKCFYHILNIKFWSKRWTSRARIAKCFIDSSLCLPVLVFLLPISCQTSSCFCTNPVQFRARREKDSNFREIIFWVCCATSDWRLFKKSPLLGYKSFNGFRELSTVMKSAPLRLNCFSKALGPSTSCIRDFAMALVRCTSDALWLLSLMDGNWWISKVWENL